MVTGYCHYKCRDMIRHSSLNLNHTLSAHHGVFVWPTSISYNQGKWSRLPHCPVVLWWDHITIIGWDGPTDSSITVLGQLLAPTLVKGAAQTARRLKTSTCRGGNRGGNSLDQISRKWEMESWNEHRKVRNSLSLSISVSQSSVKLKWWAHVRLH